MHNYLRAVGFGMGFVKAVIRKIIKKAVEEYKRDNNRDTFGKIIEIFVQMNNSMGIAIHGEFINEEEFEVEYVYPYIKPKVYNYYSDIAIEKSISQYSFIGSCDSKTNGISIIFYMQNDLDYVNHRFPSEISAEVGFSALCLDGKIILPVKEYEQYKEKYNQDMADKSKLIESARKGDEAAMENLTLDEMTLYNKISKRIQTEDEYSIVESSFMPYGMECQRYAIIGKIIDMEMVQNRITGEKCYNLTVECNHITINVGINESDLQGQPEIGRRFKGIVWLQGNIKF